MLAPLASTRRGIVEAVAALSPSVTGGAASSIPGSGPLHDPATTTDIITVLGMVSKRELTADNRRCTQMNGTLKDSKKLPAPLPVQAAS